MPGRPSDPDSPDPARRRALPWAVLLVQGLFVAVLYAPTLRLGLLSDAWVLVEQAGQGLVAAVSVPLGWHYIPVAAGANALMWRMFGTSASGYQAVMLALHLAVGHLVYRLGLALFRDVPASLAASLLFLGSASFYEVTFWPVVGNAYALAAVLFLLGLGTVLEMAGPGARPGARWRLAVWFLAAVLCYTGMVTLLPLAAIVLLLSRFRGLAGRPPAPWREPREWLSVARALLPCVAALVLPGLAKARFFAQEMSAATYFRFDWVRVYTLDQGLVSVFSLRGSTRVLHGLVTLGSHVRGGPWLKVLAWGWFLLAVAVMVRAFWRSRSLAHPLLLLWLLLQLGLTAVSIPVVSRHTYLAAVPAALLTASALRTVGLRLALRVRAPAAGRLLLFAPTVLGSLLLLWGAWIDQRGALDAGLRASDVTRRAATDIRAALEGRRGPVTVTLVDLPSLVLSADMGAYAFTNGTAEMVRIVSGRRDVAVDLRYTPPRRANLANGSTALPPSDPGALASDPARIVLIFDASKGAFGLPAEATPRP